MNAVNYDGEMRKIIASLPAGKKLLLHSCCAPCSSYCLEELSPYFAISVLYYNPNLDGEAEYERRKAEQIRLLAQTGWADLLPCEYRKADFLPVAAVRKACKEGGEGCRACFYLRLEKTARLAKEQGYDYFATTLTVSPLKNARVLNEIGYALQEKYGVGYLPTDFKKRGGYLRSIALSKQFELYRQNYCGCVFSKQEASAREQTEE